MLTLSNPQGKLSKREESRGIHFPRAVVLERLALERLAELYTSWHKAEPDAGYDAIAVQWRTQFDRWQATAQPATSSAPSASHSARV